MPRQSDGRNIVSLHTLKGSVDATGEAVTIVQPRRSKRRKGWREHVSQVDVDNMFRLEMTGSEMRVLLCLMRHVAEKGGTESRCSIAEIAAETDMRGPNVSRIMRDLRERRIVNTVRQGYHDISPWLVYSGDYESWNAEASQWPEPTWVRGVNTDTGEVN
jgi:hypothetical protein